MKIFLLIILAFSLSGCASWDRLSEREQQTLVIASSILVTGFVIAHSNDPDTNVTNQYVTNQCINSHPHKNSCP